MKLFLLEEFSCDTDATHFLGVFSTFKKADKWRHEFASCQPPESIDEWFPIKEIYVDKPAFALYQQRS